MSGYSPFRHIGSLIRKRRPIQLTLFVTRRCNAACPFCFYLSEEPPPPRNGELNLAEIERLSASLGSLLWLAFSGGEIFLRPDLAAIARIFYRRNRPAIILLPSNGMMPDSIAATTEEIARDCPKSTVVVKLSLDGPSHLHDRLRGVAGAYERMRRTWRRLNDVKSRVDNLEIGLNSVFCAANQDVMEEIIALAAGFEGLDTHSVSLIRGTVGDPGLKEVDIERYEHAAGLLASGARQGKGRHYRFFGGGWKAAQDNVQRRLIARAARRRRRPVPCHAGRLTLVVDEQGHVYPCESFDLFLGNLRDHDFDLRALMRTDKAVKIMTAVAKGGCHCTHECYMMMNILFSLGTQMSVLKEYFRLAAARTLRR